MAKKRMLEDDYVYLVEDTESGGFLTPGGFRNYDMSMAKAFRDSRVARLHAGTNDQVICVPKSKVKHSTETQNA